MNLTGRGTSVLRGFEPAPQDLVLTLLGAHVNPRERACVWSGGLVRLLSEFGFSPGASRVALGRMVARDLLTPERSGRLVHYGLTPRTVSVLAQGDRRIFTLGSGRPASRWTVLWHAIPEHRRTARTRMVRRLRFLGFGSMQDGTWIAPHDREREVAALVKELDVAEYVGVLLGRPSSAVDFAACAARIWDLADLSARYRVFVSEFRRRSARNDREALLLRTRLVHTYREFPFLDPELPENLLPAPAHRAEAVRLFHDLYPALAPGAQRYFDEVTVP
jgi:phenylacetic acid degradation operon negative regulatory protein